MGSKLRQNSVILRPLAAEIGILKILPVYFTDGLLSSSSVYQRPGGGNHSRNSLDISVDPLDERQFSLIIIYILRGTKYIVSIKESSKVFANWFLDCCWLGY